VTAPADGELRVELLDDAKQFAGEIREWLDEHAVEANMLGSALQQAIAEGGGGLDALWLVIRQGSQVVGAGMHFGTFEVFLPAVPPAAAPVIARALLDRGRRPPGVNGSPDAAVAFAEAWQELTGSPWRRTMAEQLYALDEVDPPRDVPGRARLAHADDLDLCVAWMVGFEAEAFRNVIRAEPTDPRPLLVRRIERGAIFLWEDQGERVSLAGLSPATGGLARIGPVFTPPQRRGHGYGSAVTAAATQAAMSRGARRCMLIADLANAASNRIYQRLGYRPVGEALLCSFAAGTPGP
jgi:GNAT superfamily N-acetyltransferase